MRNTELPSVSAVIGAGISGSERGVSHRLKAKQQELGSNRGAPEPTHLQAPLRVLRVTHWPKECLCGGCTAPHLWTVLCWLSAFSCWEPALNHRGLPFTLAFGLQSWNWLSWKCPQHGILPITLWTWNAACPPIVRIMAPVQLSSTSNPLGCLCPDLSLSTALTWMGWGTYLALQSPNQLCQPAYLALQPFLLWLPCG